MFAGVFEGCVYRHYNQERSSSFVNSSSAYSQKVPLTGYWSKCNMLNLSIMGAHLYCNQWWYGPWICTSTMYLLTSSFLPCISRSGLSHPWLKQSNQLYNDEKDISIGLRDSNLVISIFFLLVFTNGGSLSKSIVDIMVFWHSYFAGQHILKRQKMAYTEKHSFLTQLNSNLNHDSLTCSSSHNGMKY